MGVTSFFASTGHKINRGFNRFKEHARYYIPRIKRIAPLIIAAGATLSKLPNAYAAAGGLGLMAAGTFAETAAIGTEIGLDVADNVQKEMGWDTEYKTQG